MLCLIRRFVRQHWQGQIAPLPTVLITVLGLRMLVFSGGGLWLIPDIALLIWQLVGAIRSLRRHLDSGPQLVAFLAGLAVVGICVVLTVLPHLDSLARRSAVAPPVWTPRVGDVTLTGTTLYLRGPVDFDMFETTRQMLAAHPGVTRLILNSDGGLIYAARAVALQVHHHRLETHVDGTCASACTLIFIAGVRRSLAPTGRLGFHAYKLDAPQQLLDPVAEQEKDHASFRDQGVDPAFVEQISDTPHDQIWFPDHDRLRTAGVTTAP
ncbi:hypothetical protein K3727_12405 [Rhodobacteraceae bacterium M382]|nr:hypothetical protein K3727_12405 [Rhodobacteraceae bacterium M382]